MVREYRRRCNTVENIHKVIFVRETEESAACQITKASKTSHFHVPVIFSLYFHSWFQRFFLFLILFHTLEI